MPREAGLATGAAAVRASANSGRGWRLVCKAEVADLLSGFFMCRREVFEQALRRMSGQGFKVLLDLLASLLQPVPGARTALQFPAAAAW
jgi:dolichol-phosphate mannosyltransferase